MVVFILPDGGGEGHGMEESFEDTAALGPSHVQVDVEDSPPSTPPTTLAPALEAAQDISSTTRTINSLPNELLSHIFGFLDDTPQPSAVSGLLDEPIFEITQAELVNLKATSLVSRRWRLAILPKLFRHARFISPKPCAHSLLDEQIKPFLEFVIKNSLQKFISSFVLLVRFDKLANRWVEADKIKLSEEFWPTLFGVINPVELIIVSPPQALGALTSCHVPLADSPSFDSHYHYLRLRQPLTKQHLTVSNARSTLYTFQNVTEEPPVGGTDLETAHDFTEDRTPQHSEATIIEPHLEPWEIPRARSSPLFKVRPWSELLLNEGSFVKAYSTYEFWGRRPPSVGLVVISNEVSDGV
jgi:hypothetical protein